MTAKAIRTIAVVTGTRAEFGLLRPVMRAIESHPALRLRVVAAGAHFLPPVRTIREVEHEFAVAAKVRMQRPRETGRAADAAALGRGAEGFARAFARLKPDWVVVLGDRIEAFAAASAASIGGLAVAHIHGGDRAEGIADEAMRHAITKLSHLHCAATKQSAERIRKMGERPEHVHVTGSPAIDGLDAIEPMSDREAKSLGDPRIVVLLHPVDRLIEGVLRVPKLPESGVQKPPRAVRLSDWEFAYWTLQGRGGLPAEPALGPCWNAMPRGIKRPCPRELYLMPNHDPGRDGIIATLDRASSFTGNPILEHLPRDDFIALLKRMVQKRRGFLLGNSSAGLIECAALGVPVINVGPRQDGRERDRNVIDADPLDVRRYRAQLKRADTMAGRLKPSTRFGDGRAGARIAALLAETRLDPRSTSLLRKRNTY